MFYTDTGCKLYLEVTQVFQHRQTPLIEYIWIISNIERSQPERNPAKYNKIQARLKIHISFLRVIENTLFFITNILLPSQLRTPPHTKGTQEKAASGSKI